MPTAEEFSDLLRDAFVLEALRVVPPLGVTPLWIRRWDDAVTRAPGDKHALTAREHQITAVCFDDADLADQERATCVYERAQRYAREVCALAADLAPAGCACRLGLAFQFVSIPTRPRSLHGLRVAWAVEPEELEHDPGPLFRHRDPRP